MSVSHDHGYVGQLPTSATRGNVQIPQQNVQRQHAGLPRTSLPNISAQGFPRTSQAGMIVGNQQLYQNQYVNSNNSGFAHHNMGSGSMQGHPALHPQAQYRVIHPNSLYVAHGHSMNLAIPIRQPTPEPVAVVIKEEPEVSAGTSQEDDFNDEDAEIDIQIRNVVCNYTLPLHIDLRALALVSNNVTYDRGRGVLLKQKRNPNCYVKIYSSGKVYIVGCKSESDCMKAARTVARRVQIAMRKESEIVKIRNYKVCNVLATCKMPFGIKIEDLAQKYPAQSQYEPELSVGLVWRSTAPKATLRIHTTGSITVTGASSENDVMAVIEMIWPIVKQFRCSMRHRAEKKKPKKRQAPPIRGAPLAKRPGLSGAVGNKVYFSDEEDIYDEDDLLSDED